MGLQYAKGFDTQEASLVLDDRIRSASSQCRSDILDEHRMRLSLPDVDSADVESCDKSNLLALGKTIVWWTGENGCVATMRA